MTLRFVKGFNDMISLQARLMDASTPDEVEDLLVEKIKLRKESVIASLVYSVIDIQTRYPLLLPLLVFSFTLKIFF